MWKYAAMVVLMLTLGVGNAWGDYLTNGQILYADLTSCGNFRADNVNLKFRLRKGGEGSTTTDINGIRIKSDDNNWFCCVVPDEGYCDVQLIRCSADYNTDHNYTSFFTYSSGNNCVKPSESGWSWTSASWSTYGFAAGEVLYLNPTWSGSNNTWIQSGNEKMVAYFYGGPQSAQFVDMNAVTGYGYSVTVPYDYARVIFCRATTTASGIDNEWSQVSNQTEDLSRNANNLYSITGWTANKICNGNWSAKLINVYFRTTNDKPWLTPYLYQWKASPAANSGYLALQSYNVDGTGKWWKAIVNTTSYEKFYISATTSPNSDACNAGNKTAEWNINAISENHGYQIHCRNNKTDLDQVFENVSSLTAPTVNLNYHEEGKTIMALTGQVTNFGYDINYVNNGWECGFTLIDSKGTETNYSACTENSTGGHFYTTITGLKQGETYTVKAWAKNGYAKGTSAGTNVTMKSDGTVRVWVYNEQGHSEVWFHCWYTNNCSANVSEIAFPGKKMNRLGETDWWYYDVSYDFPHFILSAGTNETKTPEGQDKGITQYTYYTNKDNNLTEYTGGHPEAYYIESTVGSKTYLSNVVTNTTDIMSFYASSTGDIKLVKADGTKTSNLTSSLDFKGKSGAVFTAKVNSTGDGLSEAAIYKGDYNLHVTASSQNYLDEGGVSKAGTGTKFIKFETSSLFDDTYDYYWVDWIPGSQNMVGTIGNEYNNDLAGILGADAYAPTSATSASGGNVRFSYNSETNEFARAIISGNGTDIKISALGTDSVLVWNGSASAYSNDAYTAERSFGDATNWVYQLKAEVRGTAHATVKSTYGESTRTLASNKKLMGGNKDAKYVVEITYDFKTNRLIAAWNPNGASLTGFDLESNLMAVRTENGSPAVLNIQKVDLDDDKITLSKITKIYTVMEFLQSSWTDAVNKPYADRRIDDGVNWCDEYYWISLPYKCYIGDIFGIEGYGSSWVLQTYHGDYRAQ